MPARSIFGPETLRRLRVGERKADAVCDADELGARGDVDHGAAELDRPVSSPGEARLLLRLVPVPVRALAARLRRHPAVR